MRLDGKVCVITGAAGGLGRAIALQFVQEGAQLCLGDLSTDGVRETVSQLPGDSAETPWVAGDISQAAGAQELVAAAAEAYGRVDVLVNAHGISDRLDTKVVEVPEEVFDRTIAVNLKGVFLTCRAAVPAMREQGAGAIVNIASLAALVGFGGFAYTATKGAVVALSRQIAYQEAQAGIRCNSVLPGLIDTPLVPNFRGKTGMEDPPVLAGTITRIGKPIEVAHMCTYLASDESAYVTGSSFAIDGGISHH